MADNFGGADFWGAYADVSKAHQLKQLFQQQQQGQAAFGNAMQDPGIFLPGAPQAPQGRQPMGGGGPAAPANIQGLISGAAQKYGVDPSLLTGEARIESGFNPAAKNPSGASGLFQFMPKTARQYGVTNPSDPGQSADGAARLAVANRDYLTKALGRAPTNGEIYLAHQQGAGGAAKLLANPNVPAASIVGQKAVVQNGGRPDMTAWQFAQMWIGKFAQNQAHGAPAPGGGQAQGGGPQGQPQGDPQQGGRPGQLAWPHIVQAIMAKNPGLSANALAEAVDQFMPLMNQQSQMDWKEQSLQLREQALQSQEMARERTGDQRDRGLDQKDTAEQDKQARAQLSNDTRVKGLEQRATEFQQKMAAAKTKEQKAYYSRQLKWASDERHKRMTELIQRGSSMQGAPMDPATQQKLMDEEDQKYQEEQDKLQQADAGDPPQKPYQVDDQHPVPPGAVYAPKDGDATAAPAGGDTPPKSYTGDPKLWKFMKPEDRKLWQ